MTRRTSTVQMTTNPMLIIAQQQEQQQQQQQQIPLPPPPPLLIGVAESNSPASAEKQQEEEEEGLDEEQAMPRDSTIDMDMEDGTGVTLRRFGAEVRADYKNVFHYFQARDQLAVSAPTIEGVDMEQLRSAAVYEGGGIENEQAAQEVVAITGLRRGSVMALAHRCEHTGSGEG